MGSNEKAESQPEHEPQKSLSTGEPGASRRSSPKPTSTATSFNRNVSKTPQGQLEYEEFAEEEQGLFSAIHIPSKHAAHMFVVKSQNVDKVDFSGRRNISEQQIQAIIQDKFPGSCNAIEEASLSVVFCPWGSEQRIGQIAMSEQTFSMLEVKFGIPPIVRKILARTSSMVLKFDPHLSTHESVSCGLVLSNHLAHFLDFSLICVFDAVKCRTEAYCFGLQGREIDTIVHRISKSRYTGYHFILLPLLLVDLGVEELIDFVEVRKEETSELRRLLRMTTNFIGHEEQTIVHSTEIDLGRMTAQVTSINTSVHSLIARGKGLLVFIEQLREYVQPYSLPDTTKPKPGLHLEEETRRCYDGRLKYLEQAISSTQEELESLHHTLQIQSQAIYSLTAQADNLQSIKVAELSRQIAEITLRDSSDMRIIAAVTLFFLPGTFTATLFSTSFFNFQRNSGSTGDSDTVTRWIWLYWVVTGLLTALVMMLWWLTSRRRLRNSKKSEDRV